MSVTEPTLDVPSRHGATTNRHLTGNGDFATPTFGVRGVGAAHPGTVLAVGSRPRRRVQVWPLLAATFVAATGTALAMERRLSDERAGDRRAADAVADHFAAGLQASISSLQGTDGLVADGDVSAAEFAAFAADVLPGSDYAALAYTDLVDDDRRIGWEARTGLSMVDIDADGRFRPGGSRPDHAPVRYVYPVNDTTRPLLGFDVNSDPARASAIAAARAGSAGAVSGPIRVASGARPGLFAARAVRAPDGTPVGVVCSGVSVDTLLARVAPAQDRPPLTLTLNGQTLVDEPGTGGPSIAFTVGGSRFAVRTSDGTHPSRVLPAGLLLGTLALTGLTSTAARRARRAQARDRRRGERAERLALFAEQLYTLDTTEAVVDFTVHHLGALLDADQTNIGVTTPSDPGALTVVHGGNLYAGGAERFTIQPLRDPLPLTDSARTQATVVLADVNDVRTRYPHLVESLSEVGIVAVLCSPLRVGTPPTPGVIGFAWRHRLDHDEIADLVDAATLVGQLVARAYERALVREVVSAKIDRLAEFTQALTSARTFDEIDAAVETRLPALFDVPGARIAERREAPGGAVTRYPIDGGLALELTGGDAEWRTSAADTLARTVAELLEGAITRARLYDHEHAILERLQRSLLLPAPPVEGYEIAVAYRSSIESVGIGGDWYSAIDAGTHVFAAIGDVAGHGPGAVAIMAEAKTILRYLLTTTGDLGVAAAEVNSVLLRRNAFASLVIARIEKATGELTFVNAGHPAPLLLTARAAVLDTPHGPWLGVPPASEQPVGAAVLAPGATLLLYTDGLVEQRGEPIDEAIGRLARRAEMIAADPQALVAQLLHERVQQRTSRTVDDDIAVIAVRRTAPSGTAADGAEA